MVAPAPGRMPTTVPTMAQRRMVHLMDSHSFSLGILVFTLPPPMPSSAFRRSLAVVCLSTSVTANTPISTGIISMPDSSWLEPKVMRCTP